MEEKNDDDGDGINVVLVNADVDVDVVNDKQGHQNKIDGRLVGIVKFDAAIFSSIKFFG